jgi:5-methylcytosine-specific restriction protein A
MANARFSRDEVILTIDASFSVDGRPLSPNSTAIHELSDLLQKLPIHRKEARPENFRNYVGVSHQIERFRHGYSEDEKAWNVGETFFQVASEYGCNKDELHQITHSIRRNLPYFDTPYGSPDEASGFPEGILLGHLHRLIEKRDGARIPLEKRCCIYQLEPERIYRSYGALLEQHLTIDPTQMDGKRKYLEEDYITVCPNCHEALHRYRPWLVKENCGGLLR